MRPLTARQRDLLVWLRTVRVTGTGYDGSVLHALAKKGLVIQCHNAAPAGVYYTWVLSPAGEALVAVQK